MVFLYFHHNIPIITFHAMKNHRMNFTVLIPLYDIYMYIWMSVLRIDTKYGKKIREFCYEQGKLYMIIALEKYPRHDLFCMHYEFQHCKNYKYILKYDS
jgi:hypothetical protein